MGEGWGGEPDTYPVAIALLPAALGLKKRGVPALSLKADLCEEEARASVQQVQEVRFCT